MTELTSYQKLGHAQMTLRKMAVVQRRLERQNAYWRARAEHWKQLALGYERDLGVRKQAS